MSSQYVVVALIAVALQVTACQATVFPYNVDRCPTVRCASGVCRMLAVYPRNRHFAWLGTNPYCVPCVPTNIDKVCNKNHFLRALAVGNPLRPDTLVGKKCIVGSSSQQYSCPYGYSCTRVRSLGRRGVCCYGHQSQWPVDSGDPKCPDFCPEKCKRRQICRQCGDPESGTFACLPRVKRGRCPRFVRWGGLQCLFHLFGLGHKCRTDDQCEGTKKCCTSRCNRRTCFEPKKKPVPSCPMTTTTTPLTTTTTTTIETTTTTPDTTTTTTPDTTTTMTTTPDTTNTTMTTTSTTTTTAEAPF